MATADREVIDLCSSESDGTGSKCDTNTNNISGGDSGRSTTTTTTSYGNNNVIVHQPSKVYMVIHDRYPSALLSSFPKANCMKTTDQQTQQQQQQQQRQDHTVIVSVHFLLADAIGAAEDYVRVEFDVDADMDEDDYETERELDGVDWLEDGWKLCSDDNNSTNRSHDQRVYVLEKPVS